MKYVCKIQSAVIEIQFSNEKWQLFCLICITHHHSHCLIWKNNSDQSSFSDRTAHMISINWHENESLCVSAFSRWSSSQHAASAAWSPGFSTSSLFGRWTNGQTHCSRSTWLPWHWLVWVNKQKPQDTTCHDAMEGNWQRVVKVCNNRRVHDCKLVGGIAQENEVPSFIGICGSNKWTTDSYIYL